MRKVYLALGCPGSGKSTWAKSELSKDTNLVRINRDDLRNMAFNYVHSKSNEALVVRARDQLLKDSLFAGRDVIIDDTNFGNFEKIKLLIQSWQVPEDVELTEVPFYADIKTLIERDSNRPAPVGAQVIGFFWKKSGKESFQNYQPKSEIIFKVKQINMDPNLPIAIIVDLDGTAFKIHKNRNPYDASTCDLDLPNYPVINIVKMCYKNNYQIIFCSGREDKYVDPTERCIKKYFKDMNYILYMRPSSDKRKDFIIKEEIFTQKILSNFNVEFCLDDRQSVCDKYRAMGLTVLQVAPGDF